MGCISSYGFVKLTLLFALHQLFPEYFAGVEPEVNGLLFELENADDLARQLRRVSEEPGLLEKLRAEIGPVKSVEERVDELERMYVALTEGTAG